MNVQLSVLTSDANAGDVDAQLQLADLYENGIGVPLNPGQAAYWYRNAAEQGSSKAQSRLGQMYLRGIGVPEDHEQAAAYLSKTLDEAITVSDLYQLALEKQLKLSI